MIFQCNKTLSNTSILHNLLEIGIIMNHHYLYHFTLCLLVKHAFLTTSVDTERKQSSFYNLRFRTQGSAWGARTLTFSCSQLLLYTITITITIYKTPRHFVLTITVVLKNVADFVYFYSGRLNGLGKYNWEPTDNFI